VERSGTHQMHIGEAVGSASLHPPYVYSFITAAM